MAKITGGALVVRTLRAAGVEMIFGLNGAHIDTIFQSCLDEKLPIIDTRNEAAAGHAAEGYARVTNRLGVALVTAGGGFTNVITPLANASRDRTPILVISGSGAIRDTETNTLQAGIDQVAIATPLTKWAHRIVSTDQIPRLLDQAIRIALGGPRGPVLVDIPWDILMEEVEEEAVVIPTPLTYISGGEPPPAIVQVVLDILLTARRPIIVVGSEVIRGRGTETLHRFSKSTGIPVYSDYEGGSLLSGLGDHKGGFIQNLFTLKPDRPDAVLMLGLRFGLNTWHGTGVLIPHEAKIVQIDPDARELGRLQQITLPIAADPVAALDALQRVACDRNWPDRAGWRAKVRHTAENRAEKIAAKAHDRSPIHPWQAVKTVAAHIDERTIVVADGAETYMWLTEVIGLVDPAAFLTHGYLGAMGVGMGNALGAQAAAPDKRVLFVVGDGAVGYAIAEFDSLVRHGIPVIVIIFNNRAWGATLHFQRLTAGADRVVNNRLENGEYHNVARAFGAGGYYVETIEQFDAALVAARGKLVPACIDVRVDLEAVSPEDQVLTGQNPFA